MTKPIELHMVDGTKVKGNRKTPSQIPAQLKARLPFADWLDHPEKWDKKKFVKETADFLFDVYGIGDNQNQHTLGMLADHMELYIKCNIELKEQPLIIHTNDGKTAGQNPLFGLRAKAFEISLKLMTELGLTPKARLAGQKTEKTNNIDSLLKGPKAA